MDQYNLVVAGGGFAGTAAAIAAARAGLRVLLVEQSNCLGGAPGTCLVNPFMQYWTIIENDGKKEKFYLSRGIFREVLEELKKMNALGKDEGVFQEEYLKLILNRMVLRASVTPLFHSSVIGAEKEGAHIKAVTIANKSGVMSVKADYFIDATGDADLAVLCGCPYRLGRPQDSLCQPMTLCFRVANVDLQKYKESRAQINPLYQAMQKAGKIKNIREDVLIFHNLVDGVLHFNSTRIVKRSPVDAFDVTTAEIEAREQVFELFEFLKENIDGFENSQLIMTAQNIGVRESRMIDGEYMLTAEDLVACTKFDDAIAAGNYDIDIHNPEGSGTSHYYFKDGTYYTIPYRSLQPKGTDNLLVAGRCISSTHEAQASYRIMPIVCCIGEAAGTAVGIAAKNNLPVTQADIREIQDVLRKNGAFIG